MKKSSLEKELRNLKYYLKQIDNNGRVDSTTSKIISHTLVGMIMTLHNLAKTGAFNNYDGSKQEFYSLIEQARNNALHYGYFTDLNNIYPEAKKIMEASYNEKAYHFATNILSLTIPQDCYYQISSSEKSEIKEVFIPDKFIRFKCHKTGKEVYAKSEDVIIVTNKLNNSVSYLLKSSDEEIFFFKDKSNETVKISFNNLLKSGFFSTFKITNKSTKLTTSLNKILSELNPNPYRNVVARFKYDNRVYNITVHNLLNDFLNNHVIEERIANGHFLIMDFDTAKERNIEVPSSLDIKNMLNDASLYDIFFMELFLKRYRIYNELKEQAQKNTTSLNNYTKQSLLTNLFAIGASSFTDKFLRSDKTGQFKNLYYEYRSARNELAHFVSSSEKDKSILIANLEKYSDTFYNILSKIYDLHCREKKINPFSKLPNQIKEEDYTLINNKATYFYKLNHSGLAKIIDGKKYLKLETPKKNIYVEADGVVLVLNYNNFLSKQCIIPKDHAKFVEIDIDTNSIKASKYSPNSENLIHVDPFMETIVQSQDVYRSHPQFKKRAGSPVTCMITYYDKYGTPFCSEGVRNLVFRRFSQKIIPSPLLEANTMLIPNDIANSIQIINKNKVMVAKVYLACINNIDGKDVITQLLKNGEQKEIEYGKLLDKDLRTDELIYITKEGRR